MLWEIIENYLADCIVTELKKRPLGTEVPKSELLDSLPDIERQENGSYKIVRMHTVLDEDDLLDIVVTSIIRLEKEGYIVKSSYSGSYRLFEKAKQDDEVGLATLVEMEYRERDELSWGTYRGFALKERVLSEVENPLSQEEVKRIELSDNQFSELCKLLDNAGVRTWKDEYQPEGFLVLDGTSWEFYMVFEGNKAIASKGSNAWPNDFEKLCANVMRILGVDEVAKQTRCNHG